MTILADHEIKQRCTKPDAILFIGGEPVQTLWGDDETLQRSKVWQEQFYAQCDPGQTVSIVRLENIKWGDTPVEKKYQEHLENFRPMIEPFVDHQVKERHELSTMPFEDDPDRAEQPTTDPFQMELCSYRRTTPLISYGLSSRGYDLRLAPKVKVFTNMNSAVIDPKNFDALSFVEVDASDKGYVIIPPNSFVLGHSLERLVIPTDIVGVVLGKSTIARCGIGCLATPLEPGWEGFVTLEFHNTTPLPAKLYVNEGCCQVMFDEGTLPDVHYGMRSGKYNNQPAEAVPPRV